MPNDSYSIVIAIFQIIVCFLLCISESFSFDHPSLHLLVISRSTADIESYAKYSRAIIHQYLRYNDYESVTVTDLSQYSSQCVDYETYPKLCYILEELHQPYDYVVWIDAGKLPNVKLHVILDLIFLYG